MMPGDVLLVVPVVRPRRRARGARCGPRWVRQHSPDEAHHQDTCADQYGEHAEDDDERDDLCDAVHRAPSASTGMAAPQGGPVLTRTLSIRYDSREGQRSGGTASKEATGRAVSVGP